jgi:ElaB/YqjD/DUF883 family membrane-anchored ribosome-binding protein
MAIARGAAAAVEAMKERIGPALDTLDETMRQVRRGVIRGRHGAEDAVAAATLIIRRRPLGAVTIAVGAGTLVGGLVGFGLGWLTRCKK